MAKARVIGFSTQGTPGVTIMTWDGSGNYQATWNEVATLALTDVTPAQIKAAVISSTKAALQADSGFTFADSDYSFLDGLFPNASVYQTIVSQTGTSAPAVSGSLAPISSYAAGTTFTWARTGAGVYTLTASTAVFDTAGKTAIILGPLNNLNGQYTAVVTSSTVITITTALQSLAVLGLLGFTATATDAMMSKMAVEIRTYA